MSQQVDAVILAGGMARRMGGNDKGLVELNGKPMIKHAIDRIQPQVKEILINANRNQNLYTEFGFKVLSDEDSGYLGPLAGVIAALKQTQADYLLVVPCDQPMLPLDLAARMLDSMQPNDAEIAVASDGEYEQPVMLLIKVKPELIVSMQAFLDAGDRKVNLWYTKHRYVVCDFSDQPNAFVNVNTPEQKQRLSEAIAPKK